MEQLFKLERPRRGFGNRIESIKRIIRVLRHVRLNHTEVYVNMIMFTVFSVTRKHSLLYEIMFLYAKHRAAMDVHLRFY